MSHAGIRLPWGTTKEEHRAYQREYQKLWRKRHPGSHQAAKLRWQLAHPEEHRNSMRVGGWKSRGIKITIAEYGEMVAKQEGRCAICSKSETELPLRLAIDHNHATGQIRGLLCGACNGRLLFVVEHQRDLIPRAIKYLEETTRAPIHYTTH
jgi:hypothetical protein